MMSSLSAGELVLRLQRQAQFVEPDVNEIPYEEWLTTISDGLRRLSDCLVAIDLKYFRDAAGQPIFDHTHTDQYAMFVYLCSNSAGRAGYSRLATVLYALNKALHSLDVFYEVELPSVFLFSHPVGTVLGRAQYGDFFWVGQGCTSVDGTTGSGNLKVLDSTKSVHPLREGHTTVTSIWRWNMGFRLL